MRDRERNLVRKVFWVSLLATGMLILFATSYRQGLKGVGQVKRHGLLVYATDANTSQIQHYHHYRQQQAASPKEAPEDPETKFNFLEVISNQPAEQEVASSNVETMMGPNYVQELYDGTKAPLFDPAPQIHDYDDILFFTLASSLDMDQLRSLVGVKCSF